MLKLGIMLTAATVTVLVLEYFRKRRRPLPAHGWLGLIALVFAEYLMFHGIEPAATYFSPLAWTAYILLADAATFAISGHSRLRDEPRGLLKMAVLSDSLVADFRSLQFASDELDVRGPAAGPHRAMVRLRLVVRDDHAGDFHDCRADRILWLV